MNRGTNCGLSTTPMTPSLPTRIHEALLGLQLNPWCKSNGCHDLVSFLLQILQVINELNDLMTFFLILSYLSHSLSSHYLIKGKTT